MSHVKVAPQNSERFAITNNKVDLNLPVSKITSETYRTSKNSHHHNHHQKLTEQIGKPMRPIGKVVQALGVAMMINPETYPAGRMAAIAGSEIKSAGREIRRGGKIYNKGGVSKKDVGKLIQNLPIYSKVGMRSNSTKALPRTNFPTVTAIQRAEPVNVPFAVTQNIGKFDF